jgi:hypothetical protein
MKSPFSGVSSPRVPSGVGWIGVGFAVGMIVFAAAKKLAKGEFKRKRGTAKAETQPKAHMKSEPTKAAATAAAPKRPAAAKAAPATKSAPATKTASPAGREEVTAQKAAATKATQTTPKKKTTKVAAARKKTTPGVSTNPKNPRTKAS